MHSLSKWMLFIGQLLQSFYTSQQLLVRPTCSPGLSFDEFIPLSMEPALLAYPLKSPLFLVHLFCTHVLSSHRPTTTSSRNGTKCSLRRRYEEEFMSSLTVYVSQNVYTLDESK